MFTYPVTVILLCIAAACLLAEPLVRRAALSVCAALSASAAVLIGLVRGATLQEGLIALLALFILSVPALLRGNRGGR